jgi:hypothetical protein
VAIASHITDKLFCQGRSPPQAPAPARLAAGLAPVEPFLDVLGDEKCVKAVVHGVPSDGVWRWTRAIVHAR